MRTILFLLITLGASLTSLHAQRMYCSAETIRGTYGYTLTGTTPAGPVAGVGIRTFDGEGAFTQVDTVVNGVNGTTVDIAAGGTYSVNLNCTGRWFLSAPGLPPIEIRFVIVNNGKEIRWVLLPPPNSTLIAAVTGIAIRQ